MSDPRGADWRLPRRSFMLGAVGAFFADIRPPTARAEDGGIHQPGLPLDKAVHTDTCGRNPIFFPFASNSPWNTPVGSSASFADAADPSTRDFLSLPGTVNRLRWSVGLGITTCDDPYALIMHVDPTGIIRPFVNPPEPLRVPVDPIFTGGTDGWYTSIQPDGHTAWDFYALRKVLGGFATPYWRKIDLYGSGIDGGTRASRMALLGGLVRNADLEAGEINHALAISATYSQLKKGYVWPATAEDDRSDEYFGSIPMGSLFAIPGDVDIETLGLGPLGLMLARCLQNYGAYITHSGAAVTISLEMTVSAAMQADIAANWAVLQRLMRRIKNNDVIAVGGGGSPRVPLLPELRSCLSRPEAEVATPVGPTLGNVC